MKKTTTTQWSSLKVGTLLIISIAFGIWASLTGGGTSIFDNKVEFTGYFANVNGLVKGSPVWMAGVEVGNVRKIEFVNLDSARQVEVVFRIKESVWPLLTQGSVVQLGTIGLLGDKMVELIPGPVDNERIIEGNVVPTSDPGSAERMFAAGTEVLEQAGSIAGSLDSVLIRMSRGEGTLGKLSSDDQLYVHLTALSRDLTRLVQELTRNQEKIVASLQTTAEAVEHLTEKVDNSTGTLGKVISDPALYDNLASTSARLDTVMASLNNAEGSLGMLVSDTGLYVETVDLLARVNSLVADIQENPRKYFKLSVF
ncbi:MAG TPA: MlaD family protein [candidate division Zixibacteria bacterium]|nr:MlaD family protein [candidate division Zixibacteria bacterium]